MYTEGSTGDCERDFRSRGSLDESIVVGVVAGDGVGECSSSVIGEASLQYIFELGQWNIFILQCSHMQSMSSSNP